MFENLVGQFLDSAPGGALLKKIEGYGLEPSKAREAFGATVDGTAQQLGGAGANIADMAKTLISGGAPAPGRTAGIESLVAPVAQFVAGKVGIAQETALSVVGAALPKVMELLRGVGGAKSPGTIEKMKETISHLFSAPKH